MANMAPRNATTPMTVGLYVRYSTEEQHQKSFSTEMQEAECLAKFREVYGDAPRVLRRFEDLGRSGALGIQDPAAPHEPFRQGLTDLLRAVAAKELDLVLCYAQDRLARDEYLWHFMRAMAFERTGTSVLFARDDYDISTPEGQMMSSMHAMIAGQEREKTRKNVTAACRRRASEGFQNGFAPFGWQHDPDQVPGPKQRRRIVRDEAEGAVLLEIRERYLAGWLTVEICRDLHRRGIPSPAGGKHWTTSGLLGVLRNPVHAGLVTYKKETFPGAHADLRYWSPEEHEFLEQRIAERADRVTHSRRVEGYLLSAAIYCEHCGRRMIGGMDERKSRRFYTCNSPRTEGDHLNRTRTHRGSPRTCPGVSISADDLEQALRKAVSDLAKSVAVQTAAQEKLEEALDVADRRLQDELAGIDRELGDVADGFSRLFELLNNGRITQAEFDSENTKRRERELSLAQRKEDLEASLRLRRTRKQQLERALSLLRDVDSLWDAMTQTERRQLLLEIDPHITIRREEGFTVATIRPAFSEPVELRFVRRPTKPLTEWGPNAPLTERELALLALTDDGMTFDEIAKQWEVVTPAVRSRAKAVLRKLCVATLEEAIELKRQTIAECRATLPLKGRVHRRHVGSANILTPPMLAIVKLLAEGTRPVEITQILGKDKSTISRQIVALRERLYAKSMEETVARAKELGLIGGPDEASTEEDRPAISPSLQAILDLDRAGYTVEQIAQERGITPNSAEVMRNKARAQAKELGV